MPCPRFFRPHPNLSDEVRTPASPSGASRTRTGLTPKSAPRRKRFTSCGRGDGRTVLNRVLNSSSEPQSSTTYRSFVQRYRECERNAGVQWSIDFNPHPRAWHVVSDDIVYAGCEMNVDTDEFLKSLKSLQVSRCECSAKNPDSDYPTSTRKPAPDSRRCTAGARPRPARVNPISSAVQCTKGRRRAS
jgi:hypothetical protein